MILAGTGHRPDKLGGYSLQVYDRLRALAVAALKKLQPDQVISGMALGWDLALAEAAVQLEIPLTCALPCVGQYRPWKARSLSICRLWLDLQLEAHRVVLCSDKEFMQDPGCMQRRNVWMTDHADQMLALHNGSAGGTANCLRYARLQNKPVTNLWASWIKYR